MSTLAPTGVGNGRVGGAAAAAPLLVSGDAPPPGRPPVHVASCLAGMDGAGGVEMNAVRTAEALDPARIRLTVFAMRADGPMADRYRAAGVPVVQAPPVRSLLAPHTAGQMVRLSRLFQAHGVDVVHCQDNYTNWYGGLAARLAGLPLMTSKRWVSASRRHLVLSRLAYRVSTRVLANSTAVGRSVVEADGIPASRVVVVPNFVEEAAFAEQRTEEVTAWRAAWGVPAGGPVIGCVARLREEKGHATLLRAAARLRSRWPTLVVVFVGDGPEEDALRTLAAELGLSDRVCFAGHRPNRPNPNQLFDVSVLASDHEGFPNAVVEAMAAGRPVVASDVGGVPDAVTPEETGLLVPPRDVEPLAGALGRVLEAPAWGAAMGARGRAVARARFAQSSVLSQLIGVYEGLAGHAVARRRGAPA